ncbi:MAG TPA: HepT-like ribonuclease domain-containing protein [Bryobacteraceae bacterium]|nr:HepT-like ribonuclease domain-containing protein [Bryobacteraceae bacterium]
MLDSAREALEFGAGRASHDLALDRMRSLAIVRCIEIIGEAASKIGPETRTAHPEIPWIDIVGMRNRLVHAYFDIDLERVRDTIAIDLPPLVQALEQILAERVR